MTTPKIKTIFDDQKLKLTAKPIEQGARPPTFQVSTYRNNPQFTVYTNHDNGSGVTWISAGMDAGTFWYALQAIVHLATAGTNGDCVEIENKRDIPKEKRQDPKVKYEVVSKTMIGRDDDGKIWISIQDQKKANAPKIRFYFQINYYHNVRWKSNLTPGQLSQQYALGWVDMVSKLMGGLLLNNPNAAIDAENAQSAWQSKGGNSGGGYNKGGNNNNRNSGGNSNGGGNGSSGDGFGGGGFQDDWPED